MESSGGGGSLQAHELHKKFEALNEEITTALRHQQDALDAISSSNGDGGSNDSVHKKADVLRLARRALDWREDVTALSKHIELQLQQSRALRSHEAYGLLLSTSAANQKQQEDHESARVRALRSDLRLLLSFRVGLVQRKSSRESAASAHALLTAAEAEAVSTPWMVSVDSCGDDLLARLSVCSVSSAEHVRLCMHATASCVLQRQLTDFLEKSAKKEKTSAKDALLIELFEMRRELTSRISEDALKDKRQLDSDLGCVEVFVARCVAGDRSASESLPSPSSRRSRQDLRLHQHECRERSRSRRVGVVRCPAFHIPSPSLLSP